MKTYVLFCSNYLGDTIQTIPSLRKLKRDGNAVVLALQTYLLPAFEKIPWIDSFITFGVNDVTLSTTEIEGTTFYEVQDIAPHVIESIAKIENASVLTTVRLTENIKQKLPCEAHDYRNPLTQLEKPSYFCFAFAFPYMLGVDVQDYTLELGFDKKPTKLKQGINIGFSLGSLAKEKRLKRHQVDAILEIGKKLNLYAFGIGSKKIETTVENAGAISLINGNRFVGLSETLSYISEMNLFITPDSGLLHCALALKIPTIFLPLHSKTPEPWMVAHPAYIPLMHTCRDVRYLKDIVETVLQHGPVVQRLA